MLLQLDFTADVPVYRQIRNEIVRGIASGQLKTGDILPPIRTLAEDLGVNMMTVSKAYNMLRQEGYLRTDRRAGTSVRGQKGQAEISRELRQELELAAAQIKLAGGSLEDVLEICRSLFAEDENI